MFVQQMKWDVYHVDCLMFSLSSSWLNLGVPDYSVKLVMFSFEYVKVYNWGLMTDIFQEAGLPLILHNFH